MEAFVDRHLKLVEMERTEEITNSQLLLTSSSKILKSKGVCLQHMRLINMRTGLYGRTIAEFECRFSTPSHEMHANTFSAGDLVGIYSERLPFPGSGDDGDVVPAVMLDLKSLSVNLVLDDASKAETLSDDCMYRLVKLGSDVTYKRIKKGLLTLQSKSRDSPAAHLVDVLFDNVPPAASLPLPTLTFLNSDLDESQREAVAFAVSRPDVAIIHGPPGTGKTTTIIELLLQTLLLQHGHRKTRILACAPSNVAVDNIAERLVTLQPQPRIVRLGHAARVKPHIQKYSLEARLAGSDSWQLVQDVQKEMDIVRQRMAAKKGKENTFKWRQELSELRKELRQIEAKALQEIYQRAEIVLSTLTGLHEDKTLAKVQFDLVVVDECSQSVEAACWLALLRAPRCVLAGDHLQLPPTLLSRKACQEGLELSLMERILQLYPGDQVSRMLTTQYRMHTDIMGWSAQQFYEGKLKAHPSVSNHGLGSLPHLRGWEEHTYEVNAPLILIDTAGCGVNETMIEQSRGNIGEAEIVCFLVKRRISKFGLRQEEIGVITPYNLQVEFIRNRLKPKFQKLEICTVDGFQGREKELILISLVCSNAEAEIGFLVEHRRLNVAMTRGRRQVIIVCDTETLSRSKDKVIEGFVEYLRDHAAIVQTAQEFIDNGDVDVGAVHNDDFTSAEQTKKKSFSNKKKSKHKEKRTDEYRDKDKSNEEVLPVKLSSNDNKKRETKENKEEENYRQELTAFKLSDDEMKRFPDILNNRQRAIIHEVAESLDLQHAIVGEGQLRHIVIKKQLLAPMESSATVEPAGEGDRLTLNKDTANDPKKNFDEQNQHSKEPQIKEPQVKMRGTSSNGAITSAKPTAKSQENSIMRQLREYREREHQRCQQKHREKQRKDLESPEKTARSGVGPADVTNNDFDALIPAATAPDNVCSSSDCFSKVRTGGSDCSLCGHRFCSSHRIPESHGCVKGAKEDGKKKTSREDKVFSGFGIPSKKSDSTRRSHFGRRLDKKLVQPVEKNSKK